MKKASLSTAAVLLATSSAHADTITITPQDDLVAAIDVLLPGDELVLGGGTYAISQKLTIGVSGTEPEPIVIRSQDGETAIITRPDAAQNTINVVGASYLVLRNLEVVGGSHGIRLDDASFITIEGCHVHDTGDVAISANVPGSTYEGLRILRNHIHDTNNTGEGMYLGCNNDGCRMHHSLIAGNYIHHTNGGSVVQGDGIEIKEGSYDNVIRDNVIHDTNYPCIISYSTVGNGGPNVIERNAMWACGDHGIQSAADAIIRNNIILGAAGDGIHNQQHQSGSPSNLEIVHNTILAPSGDAIRTGDIAGLVLIANNALYAQNGAAIRVAGDLGQLTVTGNAGVGSLIGVSSGFVASGSIATDMLAASYSGGVPNDVFPAPGGILVGTADMAHLAVDDFNGTLRQDADVGAYAFDAAGNPGWVLAEGFKDLPEAEGGAGGAGGSSASAGGSSAMSGAGGQSTGSGSSGPSGGGQANGAPDENGGCDCHVAPGAPSRGGLASLATAMLALLCSWRRRPT